MTHVTQKPIDPKYTTDTIATLRARCEHFESGLVAERERREQIERRLNNAVEAHSRRVTELLNANNIELERRRQAEREYWRRYRIEHPESEKAKKHTRRARLKAGGRFTPLDWVLICVSADGRCLRCGHQGKLTPDHIIPLSLGGSNHKSNIQPLCLPCNQRKAVEITDYRYADAAWDGTEAAGDMPLERIFRDGTTQPLLVELEGAQ